MTDARGLARVLVHVEGNVQGVGFRWWVSRQAGRLGLVGYAANLGNGQVEVDAQGLADDVDALVLLLTTPTASGRPGRVSGHLVQRGRTPDPSLTGFETR